MSNKVEKSSSALRMLLVAACLLAVGISRASDKLEYNRDGRPILAENCFACHGPDSAARQADLRLDKREVAIEFGAIVPDKPQESSVIERITSSDPDTVMPPPKSKKK